MWLIAVSSYYLGNDGSLTFYFSPYACYLCYGSIYNTTVTSIHTFASAKYTTYTQVCQYLIRNFLSSKINQLLPLAQRDALSTKDNIDYSLFIPIGVTIS